MSERAPQGPERLHTPNKVEHEYKPEVAANHEPKSAEKAPEKQLETARHEVAQEAISGKDVIIDTSSEQSSPSTSQTLIDQDLRRNMLDRTLVRVRKKLPAPSRQLSKFVHTKPVEAISSVGEKTVARPVGILGGGIAALVGSGFTLYMARHYGYRYNFLLFILVFVAGYIVATAVEVLVKVLHRTRHGKSL